MRQISKGPIAQVETLWLLVEIETGRTIGVFQNEDLAWDEVDAMWNLYRIETEVSPMVLNGRLSQGETI